MIKHIFETNFVQLFGRNARLNLLDHQIKHFCRKPSGFAHPLEILEFVAYDSHRSFARKFDGLGVNETVGRNIG